MVNIILINSKTLGSAALRCGASSFGVKSCGKFSKYPSQFVAVFKFRKSSDKFRDFLRGKGLIYQADYYCKQVMHKGEIVHLDFVTLYQFIKTNQNKIGFKNFRKLCNSSAITHYISNYQHPHSHLFGNNNKEVTQ
ncbi:MAG: hypothetical protein DRQ13_02850 [Ignavibacteriae bacterium]|nr:MAG: hypothetical protein DRQ13_02850 [Ignavibacteriota bacterium]